MCGRYARFTSRRDFAGLAGLPVESWSTGETLPSWNIPPGRACTLVRAQVGQAPALDNLLWGLIPHWAAARPATRPINGRIETAADKPMFRRIFRYRRCLVAADGWFEWRTEAGRKQPYFLCFADRRPFFFGGVWDEWVGPDGPVPTFAILTQPPVASIAALHDRMPVILAAENYAAWLDKSIADPAEVHRLCRPPAAENLIAYPVSRTVGTAGSDGAELIAPLVVSR